MEIDARALCDLLVECETDEEVLAALEAAQVWEVDMFWRPLGENHNNLSIIGNQQDNPVSALAEKITNSIDATLINKCLEAGVDPRGSDAPQSIREAVALYYEDKRPPLNHGEGVARIWSDSMTDRQITEIAQGIWLSATGGDRPSISIADCGEGQTPGRFPTTFMSLVGTEQESGLVQSQKRDIPFVQGQYGMGSSGVFSYCSDPHKFQLILSRRNPKLVGGNSSERDLEWGFTVVRRNFNNSQRSSVYEYLAPLSASEEKFGEVLSFVADHYPLLPDHAPQKLPVNAFAHEVEHGTLVKLYEYNYKTVGVSQTHVLRKSGLLRQLDLTLPDAVLPVRVLEGRGKYKGEPASMTNNHRGVLARLELMALRQSFDEDEESEEDSPNPKPSANGGNSRGLALEGPPVHGAITIRGVDVPYVAFVFTGNAGDLNRNGNSAITFAVNGQKHAVRDKSFLTRAKVNLKTLAKENAFLAVIDCTNFSPVQREDMFMASRDRMKEAPLVAELLSRIEEALGSNDELRHMQKQLHDRHMAERLQNRAPVRHVIQNLIKASPSLARFFRVGPHVSSPVGGGGAGGGTRADFVGRPDPTFFRLSNGTASKTQAAHLGNRCRIVFETDAENNYFNRARYTGRFFAQYLESENLMDGLRSTLHDGQMSYLLSLPEGTKAGDSLKVEFAISDDTRSEPFLCQVSIEVKGEREHNAGGTGKRQPKNAGDGQRGGGQTLDDLRIVRFVKENPVDGETLPWPEGWTDRTAIEIDIDPEDESIVFNVNVDNLDLKVEQHGSSIDPKVLEARYTYGLVLQMLSLIQEERNKRAASESSGGSTEEAEGETTEEVVSRVSRALSPMILPMLGAVGSMTTDLLDEETE